MLMKNPGFLAGYFVGTVSTMLTVGVGLASPEFSQFGMGSGLMLLSCTTGWIVTSVLDVLKDALQILQEEEEND